MVDDDLVAAVRTQGGLDSSGDSLAGLDVTNNGSIFGVVAIMVAKDKIVSMGRGGFFFASRCGEQIRRWEVVSGAVGWPAMFGFASSFGRTSGTRL